MKVHTKSILVVASVPTSLTKITLYPFEQKTQTATKGQELLIGKMI